MVRMLRSSFRLGLATILAVAVAGMVIFNKEQIGVGLSSGETIEVRLAENYGLGAYDSDVKIAGIKVGTVTSVERAAEGGAVVTAKVDEEQYEELRSRPSARVRPNTLLGGKYYLELVPGGQPGEFTGTIPRERTELPVELDKITRTLQPDTLDALQGTTRHMQQTLDGDAPAELKRLLADAPGTLKPAGGVLAAARGTRPEIDLSRVVKGLHSTAAALTAQDGQLEATLDDLARTSGVLGGRAPELSDALGGLPATLESTNAGLKRLDTTLAKLKRTAGPARPVARELSRTLTSLDPVLKEARPLVSDLNVALEDTRPLVEDLVPTARDATTVLDDVRGPVLKRVNGPVLDTVRSPWHGTGPYQGGGGDFPMYKALAYAFSGLAGGIAQVDGNGNQFDIAIAAGPGSVAGLPVNLEQLFTHLMGMTEQGAR